MFIVFMLLLALLAPPATTIETTLEPLSSTGTSDLMFTVRSDTPGKYFAQASSSACLGIGPQLFFFDVENPGDAAGYTVRVSALPCAHADGEQVLIEVWGARDSAPAAVRVVPVPIANPFRHFYVPLLVR